jgi:hypothetical protein
MTRIELLESFLYFMENDVYTDLSKEQNDKYIKLFNSLKDEPIFMKDRDINNYDKDMIIELKQEIRELKLNNLLDE